MSEKPLSGHCLCGAVKFTAVPNALEMEVCHCSMCRRWTGLGFMGVACDSGVDVTDQAALGVYGSSEWGERCFCKQCGTPLFWRTRDGSHTSVSAQTFDDPSIFTLTTQIFIDEKPANYAFANQTKNMTGAEAIAQFTSSQD